MTEKLLLHFIIFWGVPSIVIPRASFLFNIPRRHVNSSPGFLALNCHRVYLKNSFSSQKRGLYWKYQNLVLQVKWKMHTKCRVDVRSSWFPLSHFLMFPPVSCLQERWRPAVCLGSNFPQLWHLGQTFNNHCNDDDSPWQLLSIAHGERKIPWLSLSAMATTLDLPTASEGAANQSERFLTAVPVGSWRKILTSYYFQ